MYTFKLMVVVVYTLKLMIVFFICPQADRFSCKLMVVHGMCARKLMFFRGMYPQADSCGVYP